jgi:hypothetical protein
MNRHGAGDTALYSLERKPMSFDAGSASARYDASFTPEQVEQIKVIVRDMLPEILQAIDRARITELRSILPTGASRVDQHQIVTDRTAEGLGELARPAQPSDPPVL